ncbi:putative glycoside hydrolase [Spirochaetota bacterium]
MNIIYSARNVCVFLIITGICTAQSINSGKDNTFKDYYSKTYSYPVFEHGGYYRNGYFFHTVHQDENLLEIAKKYIYYTDYYTLEELIRKISEINYIRGNLIVTDIPIKLPITRKSRITVQSVPRNYNYQAKGIYLTASTAGSAYGMKLIRKFSALGGNTIIFDIKDINGKVHTPVDVGLAKITGATRQNSIRDIGKLVRIIHMYHMHAVSRITVFADKLIAEKIPEYAVRYKEGGAVITDNKIHWVDPSHHEVCEYNLNIIEQVCKSGIDEVQLDYIRYPCTYSELITHKAPGTPRDKIITGFIQDVYKITRKHNVLLSLDVYGITIWDHEIDTLTTGQRLSELSKYCDAINPMIYPSHFESGFGGVSNPADHPDMIADIAIEKLIKKIDYINEKTAIRPWLQAFDYMTTGYDVDYILRSIEGAEKHLDYGYNFWSAENDYKLVFSALEGIRSKKKSEKVSGIASE